MPESKQATHVVVAGTGTVWVAPEGSTLPADLAPPAAPFVDVGYIGEDGTTLTFSRDQEDVNAWQSTDPVRVLVTAEPKTVAFELLEFDREAISLAFRGGTWSGTASPYTYTPPNAGASDVRAMIIDAYDGASHFRYVFPRVQLQGDVESTLAKSDAVRLPLEFAVLASTPSWSIIGDLPGFGAGGATQGVSSSMSRAELDALATSLGLDPAAYATKDDVVAAIEAAQSQTVAA